MKRHFSSFGQYTIAEASIDELQINGGGGHLSPLLFVPFVLNLDHRMMHPREGVQLQSINVKLTVVQTGQVATASRVDLNRLIVPKFNKCSESVHLEFPLDSRRLHELEKLRNGGDLILRLDASLLADELFLLNPERQSADPDIWAFRQRHQMWAQEQVTIPRDVWIKRILPNTGYGVIHVFEFPAATIEARAALKHSYDALQQAWERHRIGLFDDAVGKCRVALDPFFTLVEEDDGKGGKKKVPRLKPSWESKAGRATYEWLNTTLGALKVTANKNHHSPTAHFDHLESQMIIMVTTAVVSHAARVPREDGTQQSS